MKELQLLGIATTALMAGLLLFMWWDIWRRPSFPDLVHGRVHLSGGQMKWLWAIGLFVAFAAGGPQLRSRTETDGTEGGFWNQGVPGAHGSAHGPLISASSGWDIGISAYRRSVTKVRWQTGQHFRTERVAFRLPLWLPLVILGYWLMLRGQKPEQASELAQEDGARGV
ncbi:MAG: hypothetical protein P8Z36_15255 [Gemmatimonadota bacterium]